MRRRQLIKLGAASAAATSVSWRFGAFSPRSALAAKVAPVQTPLNPNSIPQFAQALPVLTVGAATGIDTLIAGTSEIELDMFETKAKILPPGFVPANALPYAGTTVWSYRHGPLASAPASVDSYIGPVIVTTRGIPTQIRYVNKLGKVADSKLLAYTSSTDLTLHWANPLGQPMMTGNPMAANTAHYNDSIPAVPHLHGGEVPAVLDGGPDAWFTSDGVHIGEGYHSKDSLLAKNYAIYRYPNTQEAGPLWFHDHTLGATRLNVYAGLAGGYWLTDPNLVLPPGLTSTGLQGPGGPELVVPLVIQDRMFDTNGELFFPNVGLNPTIHPYWMPEFLGDTIVVNGKAWPFMQVEPRRYRFLIINGSNARTYELSLINKATSIKGPAIYQIGTDGGYLDAPVKIDPLALKPALRTLVMMPGERADIIIDFAGQAAGTKLLLQNDAKSPYEAGSPPSGTTVGRIMQFQVVGTPPPIDPSYNPALGGALRTGTTTGTQTIVRLPGAIGGPLVVKTPGATQNVQKTRHLTLNEIMGPAGPQEILVNNTKWDGKQLTTPTVPTANPIVGATPKGPNWLTELPDEGTTEIWEIINLTADAHPIHLHLVQFQLMNRQAFNLKNYNAVYAAAFPGGPGLDPMTGMGMNYLAGVYVPAFGPPLAYNTLNAAGAVGGNPDPALFLVGLPLLPAANEAGWKDTVMVSPGMITRFVVRFAPTDQGSLDPGQLYYPFDPSEGTGYVWHCHIIDHEDNEMMRPYSVNAKLLTGTQVRTYVKGTDY